MDDKAVYFQLAVRPQQGKDHSTLALFFCKHLLLVMLQGARLDDRSLVFLCQASLS